MTTASTQLVVRHFGKNIIKKLKQRGIEVLAYTTLPDENGSFANPRPAYMITQRGIGKVWTYTEILEYINGNERN